MRCHDLERWLDEGMPESERPEALRHVGACAGCADLLEAAEAIESMLRLGAEPSTVALAPAMLVDRVMARIEGTKRIAVAERKPWWVLWASDPTSVVLVTFAVVIGALARWYPGLLMDAGLLWVSTTARWTAAFSRPLTESEVRVLQSAAIGLAPLAIWGLLGFYRSLERFVLLFSRRRT